MRISASLLFSLACLCSRAWAQSPTPEPTPRFDTQETPITAGELATELGYKFYGNTWKFSGPTFVRVRVWSADGSASEVSTQPPRDARWIDVYAPDEPQSQITVRVLEKNDKENANGGQSDYPHVQMTLKISVSGKDMPENMTPGNNSATITGGAGVGISLSFGFVKGPREGFNDEWRYANGNLGVALQGFVHANADAATYPGQPGQKEVVEANLRDHAEAGLRTAPLNVFYYKGEISGMSDEERQKNGGGSYDTPRKRAVCLVTLECSREPFKADAAVSTAWTDAKVASGQ